jgi:hypothetical protein
MLDGARKVTTAARLLLKDLLRRRLTLLLLFVVPALFDAIVLVTTGRRPIEVTLAALVEEGAAVRHPGDRPDPFDLGLLDDGLRALDQRSLSLVFLGGAAVCFLSCFLAFYLVHKRTEIDARLVLAGFRPHEVLGSKLAALGVLVLVLAAYETAIIRPYLAPRHVEIVALGFALGGLVYGCLGLLIGAISAHELEGVFLIVLLANVDVGWLQNPIYYASSDRRSLIESLPGHASTQIAMAGAFADRLPGGLASRSLLYAAAALAAALAAFGLRIRPARPEVTPRAYFRWHYAKVLLVAYALWFAAFQVVGRWAATLPTIDPTTSWDRAIPVVPAFVWPYELCYLFPFASILVLRDWHRFNVAVVAILLANLTAFAVYLLVPVAFPRPELGGSLAEKILAMEYAADFHPGANKLPSMHVALSWIMGVAMLRQAPGRLADPLIALTVLAITASTLFVKQHILVDVAAGVAWGLGATWIARKLYPRLVDPEASPDEALWQALEARRWIGLVRRRREPPLTAVDRR